MGTSQLFLGARCHYVGKHIKGIFNDSDDGSKWCFFPGLGEICFSLAPKWVSHNGSGSQDCSTRGNPKSGAPAKKSSPNITKTPHGEDPFWACACERESARVSMRDGESVCERESARVGECVRVRESVRWADWWEWGLGCHRKIRIIPLSLPIWWKGDSQWKIIASEIWIWDFQSRWHKSGFLAF